MHTLVFSDLSPPKIYIRWVASVHIFWKASVLYMGGRGRLGNSGIRGHASRDDCPAHQDVYLDTWSGMLRPFCAYTWYLLIYAHWIWLHELLCWQDKREAGITAQHRRGAEQRDPATYDTIHNRRHCMGSHNHRSELVASVKQNTTLPPTHRSCPNTMWDTQHTPFISCASSLQIQSS